jgi:hypothetical protein
MLTADYGTSRTVDSGKTMTAIETKFVLFGHGMDLLIFFRGYTAPEILNGEKLFFFFVVEGVF